MYRYLIHISFLIAVVLSGIAVMVDFGTVAAQDIKCQRLSPNDVGSVSRYPAAGGGWLWTVNDGGSETSGSNWWWYDAEKTKPTSRVEPSGIAIFDLESEFNKLVLPNGAKVLLNLSDVGGKQTDDPRADSDPDPTPNKIKITAIETTEQVTVEDRNRGGTVVATITSSSEQAGRPEIPGSALLINHSLDVTEIVRSFIDDKKRYLGFRFDATQPSDSEDFFVHLQVVIDAERIIHDAFKPQPKENQVLPNTIFTKNGSIKLEDNNTKIVGVFTPYCGKSVPLVELAKALGIDHFNWEQTIRYPDYWRPQIWRDIKDLGSGKGCTNYTDRFGNPSVSLNVAWDEAEGWVRYCELDAQGNQKLGEAVMRKVEPSPNYDPVVGSEWTSVIGVPQPINSDTVYWFPFYLPHDDVTPYYDEPSEIKDYTYNGSLYFEDAPIVSKDTLVFRSDFLYFETSLIGVTANNEIVRWPNVGFQWKSNVTSDGGGSIEVMPSSIEQFFPVLDGGISIVSVGGEVIENSEHTVFLPLIR